MISAEFLLLLVLTLVMVSALASGLMHMREEAVRSYKDLRAVEEAESAARTVEFWLHAGRPGRLDFADFSFRIKDGMLVVDHRGDLVEVRGVFRYDDAEPL